MIAPADIDPRCPMRTAHLTDLTPVSRASVRLTDGDIESTVVTGASDENGSGPQCPRCGETMRPLPGREPGLVRCENVECSWFMAPFRSGVEAVRPVKVTEEVQAL